MNELQKLYDLLSREGYYTKSFEEFQQQYNDDPSYRDKVFGVVSRDGFYTKTKEEFLTKYASAQPEVKKKEDGQFDFGSQEGSTDATATQEVPDGSLASEQSQVEDPLAGTILSDKSVSEDTYEKSMAGITPELIENQEEYTVPQMNYNFNQYGFTFEETGVGDAMKVTAANGQTLTVDLDPWFGIGAKSEADNLKAFIEANKAESQVINARSRYKYEKTQAIQDEKEITAAVKTFNDLTEKYQQDVEAWAERSRELQGIYQAQYAELTPQQIAQDPALREGYAEFVSRNKQLQSEYSDLVKQEEYFKEKGQRLDELAGAYSEMRSQQGTLAGGIWNQIMSGFARQGAATLANIGTDIMTAVLPYAGSDARGYKTEFIKVAKEKGYESELPEGYENMHIDDIVEKVSSSVYDEIDSKVTDNFRKDVKFGDRQYRNPYSFVAAHTDTSMGIVDAARVGLVEVWGDKSTTQQWIEMQQQGFWGGAILGLAESLPAMIGGSGPAGWAQRTAQMYGQVTDHVNEEMENDAAFDDITENEKYMVTAPIGIAVGTLEAVGFRNVINQGGFVNKIVARALRKSTENTTAKTFAQFIREDITSLMGRGLLTMTAGGLAEFETGALQEVAEVGVKRIYNISKDDDVSLKDIFDLSKGKKMFQTPDTWTEFAGQVLRAGAQEAVGGFIMSTPSAVINAVSKGETSLLPEGVFEMFQEMSKDPKYKTMHIAKLKQQVQSGEMTLEEAKSKEEKLNKLFGIMPQIPTDLSVEGQKRALELLYEKQGLESEIEGKDPNLVKKKIDRVAAINEEMQTLIEETAEQQAEQQEIEGQILEMGEVSSKTQVEEATETTEEERADIESFFGQDTESTTRPISDNLSINRKGDFTYEGKAKAVRDGVVRVATMAANSISKVLPETKIILHESNEEYLKYVGREGRGEYVPSENAIHINLSTATRSTVPHEIFHAVFINKVKTDEKAAKMAEAMMLSVRKSLANDSDLAKRIDRFAAQYTGDQAQFQNEERIAELTGILSSEYRDLTKPQKNIIIQFLQDFARKFGIELGTDFNTNDEAVIDLLNTLSRKTRTGEEITVEDISVLDNGTNPIGGPTEIRMPQGRQSKIGFQESYENSLVTPDKKVDIYGLLEDIVAKKQKVWFWVADQLGINEDFDGGPSFAHQKDGDIWASSMSTTAIDRNIKKSDYIFIISGSPTASKLFNKKVFDKMVSKLGDYETFKKNALETKPTKVILETLEKYPSWEALRESTGRKPFLIALNESQSKPNTKFHQYVQSLDGYFDINDFRDGFYREHGFEQNDIMLVLRPTGVRSGSEHSTYENTVEGEVIGVPDAKINALEVMPQDMADKYAGRPSQAAQAIAPYGTGVKEVTTVPARRQQKTIEGVAQQWNMNINGFFPNNVDAYNLRKAVRALGYDIKQSRVDQYGRGGSYYLVNANGKKVNPFYNRSRQQKSMNDIIQEGRDNNFRDAAIRDYLIRVRKFKASVVDAALAVQADLFTLVPDSFKNITGGVEVGVALWKRVDDYKKKLVAANARKTKLTPAELDAKVREYAKQQRKTYKKVTEINQEVKEFKENLLAKNARRRNPLTTAEVNQKVREFRNEKIAERDAKKAAADEKVIQFKQKETVKNNKRQRQLSEQEIMDKVIEFLENQQEYKNEADRGLSTIQARMLSDLQRSVGIRPTQDMAAKIRMARLVVRQRSRGARDLDAVKREIRNFIRKALPPELYTKSEVVNMVRKVAQANQDNIENIMNEVFDFAVAKNVAALNRSVNNLLNGKYEQVVSGRKKGIKIDLATQERIKRIKKAILSEGTAEEVAAKNEELNQKFNELQKKPDQTEADREQMVDIEIAINLNNALLMGDTDVHKVAALDEANNSLVELVELGRATLKQELKEAHDEYVRQFELVYGDVVGAEIDMDNPNAKDQLQEDKRKRNTEAERSRVRSRIRTWARGLSDSVLGFFISHEALDGLMDKISSLPAEMFGGRTQELITDRVDEASRNFKERRMYVESRIKEKLQELYGKRWSKQERANRQKNVTGIYIDKNAVEQAENAYNQDKNGTTKAALDQAVRENELVLSQNQMYYLYNQFKDPSNHGAFQKMFGSDYQRVMQEMEQALAPEVKEFADWQVNEFFPELYEHYNDVYRRIYRTNLPWNKFYAGRIYREGVEQEALDLLADNSIYNTSVGAASTKFRTNNNLQIKKVDGTDALITYLNDMEYFASYAETVRDINKLFTNDFIASAITDIHGAKTLALIKDQIQKIAAKGTRREMGDKIVDGMNTAFILSRLAISPVVMIKQLTSLFTYADNIGIMNWLKYSAKNITELKSIYQEVRDNSVYMQDRKNESIMRAIESYSEESQRSFVPQQTKDWIVNFMMWTTKFGDRTAIYMGGLANYSYYKAQALSQGKTEQEAIEIAVRKFEKDTKRTQQSGDLQDKDIFQTKNALSRAANMFLTTPKQYLRKEIQAIRNLYRKLAAWDKSAGKGTIGENMRTLLMYHVFMPVFFQWVAMGMPLMFREWREDDEEDLLRAGILGNINGLFILGEVFTAVGDYFTDKPWAGESSKSVGIINTANGIIKKFKRADQTKDPEKKAQYTQEAILELVTLTGLPAPTVSKFIDNYSKLGQGDLGETILRLLNYSEYQIEGPKKKAAKPAKTIEQMNQEYDRELKREERARKQEQRKLEQGFGGGFNEGFGGGFEDGFN